MTVDRRLRRGCCAVLAVLAACGSSGSPSGNPPAGSLPVETVSVALGASALIVGGTTQAAATLRDSSGNVLVGRIVTWSSTDASVASVSASGLVTAMAPGRVAIVAASEGKTGSAEVRVESLPPPPVASVSVALGASTLIVGGTTQATAALRDSNGNVLSGRTVTWSSSDVAVVTVDGTGAVTAAGVGTALVAASSEGKTGSAGISVLSPVASVSVTLSVTSVVVGQAGQAAAIARDAAGNELTGRAAEWRSSAPGVVSIDASGRFVGLSLGAATLAATIDGKTGSADVSVIVSPPTPVATVQVALPPALQVRQVAQATATLRDAGGNVLAGRSIAWSSSNPSVATVDGGGAVTAHAPGTVQISASSEGQTGWASTTVSGCSGRPVQPLDSTWTISIGGIDRTVLVHVPATYDTGSPAPLVLNFHGYGSSASQQAALSRMNLKADAAGFVVAYPQGVGNSWNAGACCGDAVRNDVDDIGFLDAVLQRARADLCLDDRRIFATGMSNGAFFSHRLACERADRIAAIAPVAGVMGMSTCAPARPISVQHFHGTADSLVPYGGSALLGFPSVADSVAGWAARDGCTGGPIDTYVRGDSRCQTHGGCGGGAEVTLCTVTDGGHTWPGGLPVPLLGKTTTDLSATDAMWDFFVLHPLPR